MTKTKAPTTPGNGVPKAPAGQWYFVTDRGARSQIVPELRHQPGDWFEPKYWNRLTERQRRVLVEGRYIEQKFVTE